MSSILEALRELEGDRPPATRREIPPPEKPSILRRLGGAVIPILGGLAVGIVVFGVYSWGPRGREATPDLVVAPATAPVVDAPRSDRPAWLDTAEAPRAQLNRTPPLRQAVSDTSPSPEPRTEPRADPRPEPPAEPRPATSGGQVVVESITYAANPALRVATLRIHGRRVTLRQRESVDGVEVQLIMPNAVYLQRGSEVYLMPLSR